jgi:hypothetical protein
MSQYAIFAIGQIGSVSSNTPALRQSIEGTRTDAFICCLLDMPIETLYATTILIAVRLAIRALS